MGKNKTFGFLLAMMEPPAEMEEEFNEWYDTEHVPERKAVPGILSAVRFVAYEGSPRYLALYDLKNTGVLQSKAYKRIGIDNLSPWSKRIIRHVRGFKRNVYEQISPGKAQVSGEAKALLLWAYDVDASGEAEFNQWYREECIPHLQQIDRFINDRRFICVEGSPRYLTLFEFRDIEFFRSEAYKKALFFGQEIGYRKYLKETIYNIYEKYVK